MSVPGHKRKSRPTFVMSVKPPKAEVAHTMRNVRFAPVRASAAAGTIDIGDTFTLRLAAVMLATETKQSR